MNTASPSPWNSVVILATWFGAGRLPRAPGTWGSIAALPIAWPILAWGGPMALLLATALIFLLGCWAADGYEKISGRHDPSEVVIDEVAGQWLALTVAGLNLWMFVGAFLLFRLFDITKPWPIRWVERRFPGGLGIMLDDIVAGVFAAAILYGISRFSSNLLP